MQIDHYNLLKKSRIYYLEILTKTLSEDQRKEIIFNCIPPYSPRRSYNNYRRFFGDIREAFKHSDRDFDDFKCGYREFVGLDFEEAAKILEI